MNQSAEIALHIPRLRRYARALTGERATADDLVQDTLERALNKFHLWRQGSDLRAWLFTIMHNVYVNQLRSSAHTRHEELTEEALEAAQPARQTDMLEMRDLDTALRKLPDEQREIVLLVGLEQLSYEEAAKALGVPIGTVMSRLSRARERLRCIMAGLPEVAALKVVK
ncbi:MAG: RNA polymerase sigma factor [Burkholderiales bacterium]|nr:RNA polymerase sigma factor [Burkholderiales bacterium]